MSAGRTTKKWILKRNFKGVPTREDLEIITEQIPALKDGEFLLEGLFISVDPYLRLMLPELGTPMLSGQVAKVIESKNADYSVGDLVFGNFGWVTHSISNGSQEGHIHGLRKLDPKSPVPSSTALGILGMPGATAYYGLLELCKPKAGETLIVNGAAGAVGSAVGQIGKIKGMRVVGFAGSDEKVEYLKRIGFDAAYNYKKVSSLSDAITESCPNGVDVFFDNVGGDFFETVLSHMNTFGRVSVCGCISQYNLLEPPNARPVSGLILGKQLTVQGFMVTRWLSEWGEAFKQLTEWIVEGKLKYEETEIKGFENTFDAFIALFKGTNIGKAVVKI